MRVGLGPSQARGGLYNGGVEVTRVGGITVGGLGEKKRQSSRLCVWRHGQGHLQVPLPHISRG